MSIKVKTADSTEHGYELGVLLSLQDTAEGHHIVRQLDEFVHHGPNGDHQCLVFELLGPSVGAVARDYREVGDQLDPEIILKIANQMLEALSFIHKLGYAHGGLANFPMCKNKANSEQISMTRIWHSVARC